MKAAAAQVTDPSSKTLLSESYDFTPFPSGPLEVLGSGSDYTSFIHHLGVPSADYGWERGRTFVF
jgi:N-acetylated-alpha-linked acidic dipeptidase